MSRSDQTRFPLVLSSLSFDLHAFKTSLLSRSLYWISALCVVIFSPLLAAQSPFKPLVLFQGELKAGSYQQLIEQGILRFEEKSQTSVTRQFIERDNLAYIQALSDAAQQGYSPIVVQDANSLAAFDKLAREYPSTRFISLDVAYNVPNILGLTFNQAEGAYVVGFLAGLKTTSNHVGFIGGLDIPVINNFKCGYELGVMDANPKANISVDYINNGSASWDDTESAYAISQKMLNTGVDVIFPVTGYASAGVLDSIKENGKSYGFGVDYDYSQAYPNASLASLEKKVDVALFAALMQLKHGIWNGNRKHFGIKQGVIQITLNDNNPNITASEKQRIESLVIELKGKNNAISQKVSRGCPTL